MITCSSHVTMPNQSDAHLPCTFLPAKKHSRSECHVVQDEWTSTRLGGRRGGEGGKGREGGEGRGGEGRGGEGRGGREAHSR